MKIKIEDREKALAIIAETLANIDTQINVENLPTHDAKTIEVFTTGQTTGVYLFEMAKIRHLLKRIKSVDFDQLAGLVTLYYSDKIEFVGDCIVDGKLELPTSLCSNYLDAHIAYQTAYLKAHYTEDFMVATIKNHIGNEEWLNLYMNECKRLGVRIYGL
ncbi:MAG: hypothetical protein SNH27_17820 [Rikenellaceae bacterium]